MPAVLQTALLLVISNAFMTYAWYGHLRDLAGRPWYVAALAAWGVAFFEYQFQVPANRNDDASSGWMSDKSARAKKGEPIAFWQLRQWQARTLIGSPSHEKRTAPQRHPPSRVIGLS